jgi:mRNA-degrading endonuclease RelE of RelBE toxin-antitoxin system
VRYRLKIDRQVQRQIERLPGHVRQHVLRLIDSLLSEPTPPAAKPLTGTRADKWQISLDVWRIVYPVDDEAVVVEALRAGKKHGPEFYEGLEALE